MRVVDASALYYVLLNTERSQTIRPQLDDDLFAPDLLLTETLDRLRRHVAGGIVDPMRADAAVDLLQASDIEYLHVWPHTRRMWELRHNVTPYDSCYVALAEELGCPLVTADARLSRAPGVRATIILV